MHAVGNATESTSARAAVSATRRRPASVRPLTHGFPAARPDHTGVLGTACQGAGACLDLAAALTTGVGRDHPTVVRRRGWRRRPRTVEGRPRSRPVRRRPGGPRRLRRRLQRQGSDPATPGNAVGPRIDLVGGAPGRRVRRRVRPALVRDDPRRRRCCSGRRRTRRNHGSRYEPPGVGPWSASSGAPWSRRYGTC